MNLQNFGECACVKANIVQFTTKSGSKSSLIVKKWFIAKFRGLWQPSTQKTALTVKKCRFFKQAVKGLNCCTFFVTKKYNRLQFVSYYILVSLLIISSLS